MTSLSKQKLSEPSPELLEKLKETGPMQLPLDVNALRSFPVNIVAPWPDVVEKDVSVKMRDGESITVRIYTARGKAQGPALVMYHGGGYVTGDLQQEESKCRGFCRDYGGIAFNVDYRLAPENPFPGPVNDCWDALKWVVANVGSFGFDTSKGFIIGGTSAGATLCIILSLLYRDEKPGPPLTGTYLSLPSVISASNVPEKYAAEFVAWEQNKDAPVVDQKALNFFRDNHKADPYSPLACPLLWPTGFHSLPPAYFQLCGLDPLRDDGLIWERILREECGVKTKLDIYAGWPHGFWVFFADAEATRKYEEDTIAGFKWLMEQGSA